MAEPEHHYWDIRLRRVAGIPENQLTMQAVVLWPLLATDSSTDR